MAETEPLSAVVHSTRDLADGVRGLRLRRADGLPFPALASGAHLRVELPSGLVRPYSITDPPGAHDELGIAVALDEDGRGGSREVFGLRAGDRLRVVPVPSTFTLDPTETRHVLVAGGIGITPIWSMIQQAEASGAAWELHYAARSAGRAAFREELEALERAAPGRVRFAFSAQGPRLDLPAIVASAGPGAGVYCCGPHGIVEAFTSCAAGLGARAHVEDFTAVEAAAGGFDVEFRGSGITAHVPEDSTILDVALEAGIDIEYSCMSGTCGSCVATVLDGVPDHRDEYLTEEEQGCGKSMLICCSGCRVGPLVLDL